MTTVENVTPVAPVTMSGTDVPRPNNDPSAGLSLAGHTYDDGERAGPANYLAPERQRLQSLTWQHITARLLSPTVGAEVSGVDLREHLSDDVIAEIAAALAEYKVLFFRDQPVTSAQHIAFAKRFGELEIHPFIPSNTEHRELVRFEKSAEVAGYENSWHHDVTWREVPSKAAVLHAIHIPPVGGDTLFSDMNAAYMALDDATRELIDGLDAEHDFMQSFGRVVKPEDREAMREKYPVVTHPVVATHPVSGRKTLYVNRNFTTRIVGLDDAASDALLKRLFRQAAVVEHQVRLTWQKDTIAMWDNLGVQHYASSDYWPEVRIMERASITGLRPSR